MNPKPFFVSNHFTLPVAIAALTFLLVVSLCKNRPEYFGAVMHFQRLRRAVYEWSKACQCQTWPPAPLALRLLKIGLTMDFQHQPDMAERPSNSIEFKAVLLV